MKNFFQGNERKRNTRELTKCIEFTKPTEYEIEFSHRDIRYMHGIEYRDRERERRRKRYVICWNECFKNIEQRKFREEKKNHRDKMYDSRGKKRKLLDNKI